MALFVRLAKRCPYMTTLVIGLFDTPSEEAGRLDADLLSAAERLTMKVVSLRSVETAGRELIQSGRCDFERDVKEIPTPSDVVTVIFSSGSTGRPKGTLLSDGSFMRRINTQLLPPDPCVVVSYMPLCHSFDRLMVLNHIIVGGRAAFHRGAISTILDTLQEVRPTSFSSTPRLWNSLFDDFNDSVRAAGGGTEAERLALDRLKGVLGGRTAMIGTGGAKTAPAVLAFMRRCFRCSVSDGFGATEAGGITWDGAVGGSTKTMLIDAPELGYLTTDKPHPRGELCVSNDTLADGYLDDPGATAEAFFTDQYGFRWYRTGDICMQLSLSRFEIIGR
jgi:long-subunit acyl-CoA synthetase (AMP-forming)